MCIIDKIILKIVMHFNRSEIKRESHNWDIIQLSIKVQRLGYKKTKSRVRFGVTVSVLFLVKFWTIVSMFSVLAWIIVSFLTSLYITIIMLRLCDLTSINYKENATKIKPSKKSEKQLISYQLCGVCNAFNYDSAQQYPAVVYKTIRHF